MKTLKTSLILAMICVMLAGCASDNALKILSVNAKDLEKPVYGEENPTAATVAQGANDFAFRLSAALITRQTGENFVCSPYSIWMPLAALVNATDEQNKPALLEALGTGGINQQDINQAASRMLYSLSNLDQAEYGKEYAHNPLKIANAIFVDNNVTLKKSFAQTFADYYRGAAMNVDFSTPEAVDAVNAWASENTQGLITEIVKEFDPDVVAALANAIYFSDRWQWEFDESVTKEGDFHAPSGDTKANFMCRVGDAQPYYEDDILQATALRFKSNGGLYILLPKNGDATALLTTMTHDYFQQIQSETVSATGKLLLPRFSIQSEAMPLNDTLISLGVPLFDSNAAPLTGGLLQESIPVWLSSAVHKATIDVDEKGTTAAAVTVMTASGSAMPAPTKPFEMTCDKPFVFLLYSHTHDGGAQVLFTGVVNKP